MGRKGQKRVIGVEGGHRGQVRSQRSSKVKSWKISGPKGQMRLTGVKRGHRGQVRSTQGKWEVG